MIRHVSLVFNGHTVCLRAYKAITYMCGSFIVCICASISLFDIFYVFVARVLRAISDQWLVVQAKFYDPNTHYIEGTELL